MANETNDVQELCKPEFTSTDVACQILGLKEGFPGSSRGRESACNAGDRGLIPGVRKIPWRKKWQPAPVCLAWKIPWSEEPGSLQSRGHKGSDTLSDEHFHF